MSGPRTTSSGNAGGWIEINGHRDSFDKLDPEKPFRVQLSTDLKRVVSLRQGRRPK